MRSFGIGAGAALLAALAMGARPEEDQAKRYVTCNGRRIAVLVENNTRRGNADDRRKCDESWMSWHLVTDTP